jgi:hypothetical protein
MHIADRETGILLLLTSLELSVRRQLSVRLTARVEQLAAIKGVSKAVAIAIVRARPYESIEGLLEVRGIGPKLLEKLRPLISL